ncbi:MAG: hypothetical protein IPI54_14730 [Chitinophagaceae bacterium]|nr:hypothetical protein [Chitinophagaceae bacterium]
MAVALLKAFLSNRVDGFSVTSGASSNPSPGTIIWCLSDSILAALPTRSSGDGITGTVGNGVSTGITVGMVFCTGTVTFLLIGEAGFTALGGTTFITAFFTTGFLQTARHCEQFYL